jgi:D-3-phosphoglycerate dehydrogenase
MAARQLRNFLESGAVNNSVNFPSCRLDGPIPQGGVRLCIANKNVPNMVGQITTILAANAINIAAMVNQQKAGLAYNIIDVDSPASGDALAAIAKIDGVVCVREIRPQAAEKARRARAACAPAGEFPA